MSFNEKDYEKKVLATLKNLDFKTTAYYPYDSRVDIMGILKTKPPFLTPIKTLVTVIKGKFDTNKKAPR